MAAPVFEKKFVQDIRQPVRVRRCGDLMFTGDANADTIYVEVYNDGSPYNITGTVTLNCIRADGATVAVTGSISGNVAQATLAQACCAISGPLAVVMKITSGDVTSTILKAVYTVDVGVTGTTVDPGTIVSNVNTLIAAIETATASVPADYSDLLAAIAPTYSNASTYAVGDYVWYDGDLYRCTTAISTAESWTAAHWAAAVVGNDIAELKNALAEKLDAPSTAGTAGQALVTDGNGGVSWANVEIEVDATLSQSGEAADAKATGDEIAELKSAVGDIEDAITKEVKSKNLLDTSKLTVGKLNSSGGVDSNMTSYSTSDYIPVEAGKSYVFGNESHTTPGSLALMGYSGYGFYNTEKVWIANSRVWDNNGKVALTIQPNVDGFVRVGGGASNFTNTTASFIVQEGTTLDGWEAYVEPYTEIIALTTDDIAQNFGQNTDKVVSQKTITDAIGGIPNVTGAESLVNLYNKSLLVVGKYINNGSEVANETWAYTGKIPVKPNTQYNLSIDKLSSVVPVTSVFWYDTNNVYQGTISLQSYVYSYLLAFVTPADAGYIAVDINWTNHTESELTAMVDTMMLCYGTQRPSVYSPYNVETVLLSDKLDNYYFNPDVFTGKKWLVLGTSITWYDSKEYSAGLHTGEVCSGYVGNVARRKALLVTNEGISGSTLALTSSDNALINRYTSFDWTAFDICTIEFGVNDFGHAVAIGTADDTPGTSTFAACLKTIIEYALAQNPKLCLVICTEPDVRGSTANSGGHYLYEYTDVTLAIAKQYRLPVCDWFYHSGINAVTKGSSSVDYLTADGTHPNDAGHLRMGAMLNQVFDSLIC